MEQALKKQKKLQRNADSLAPTNNNLCEVSNNEFRLLGRWSAVSQCRQNNDFTIPIHRQFDASAFPSGEFISYGMEKSLLPNIEELTAQKITNNDKFDAIRRAAEAHRQTRRFMQSLIKPGMTTLEVVQMLESKSKELIGANGLNAGWAFPTGISVDNCAAHYTPNYGEDPVVITNKNIVKIDFGVHVEGHLVDCAFTLAFDEKFDPLIKATQEATNHALKICGVDMLLGELGGEIEEVIRSFEMEVDGKTIEIKPIANLSGHSILPYRIHAKKSVPLVKCADSNRMLAGEVYAIETFATTGRGKVINDGNVSHYMLDFDMVANNRDHTRIPAAKNLLQIIKKNFGTLAFCRRWLDDLGQKKHLFALRSLIQAGIVVDYPPLSDVLGSYTSQSEHTVILHDSCKEVVTRGEDY